MENKSLRESSSSASPESKSPLLHRPYSRYIHCGGLDLFFQIFAVYRMPGSQHVHEEPGFRHSLTNCQVGLHLLYFSKERKKKHSSSFVELIQLFYLSFASQGMHQHCLRNSRTQNGRQKAEGKNGPSFIVFLLLFLLCYFLTNAGCWLLLIDGPGHSSTSLCVGPGPGCVLILLIFLSSLLAF